MTPPSGGALLLVKATTSRSCTWNKLQPVSPQPSGNFSVAPDGSMVVAVAYQGTIDFGAGPLSSAGTTSLGIARFDALGNPLWGKSAGTAGTSVKYAAAQNSTTVDFGAGPIATAGNAGIAALGL